MSKSRSTYHVLVDVDTHEEHGPASYQARERLAEAKKKGDGFIKMIVAGVEHRVTIVAKEVVSAPIPVRVISPDQAQEAAHVGGHERLSVIESSVETYGPAATVRFLERLG